MDDNVNNIVSNNNRIANDSNVADEYRILSNLTSNINNTPATSGGLCFYRDVVIPQKE